MGKISPPPPPHTPMISQFGINQLVLLRIRIHQEFLHIPKYFGLNSIKIVPRNILAVLLLDTVCRILSVLLINKYLANDILFNKFISLN